MWYFPKGVSHTLQGVQDAGNEVLLCFDDGNFEALGTTFHIVDWLAHAPKEVLAKNFGVSEAEFDNLPSKNPYMQFGNVTESTWALVKNESEYLWRAPMHLDWTNNTAGRWVIVDKTKFPILNSMAATVVILKPGRMRELHWNTNVYLRILMVKTIRAANLVLYRGTNGSTSTLAKAAPPCLWVPPLRAPLTSSLVTPRFSQTTLHITSRTEGM